MGKIVVANISKAYKRYPGKFSRIREWITGKNYHKKIWVLRDINFEILPGESVGIIGVNGAGKSTLLKIITGTTQPTSGSVDIQGKVAALLELGMGFHPDFTGRQNALMAGQLLGYSAKEIAGVMDEIESFAEIGDYIDRPVRVYSSGMQVRLAFSVATAIRPPVLIVDEALAVGDIAFQRKCFARIEKLKKLGTTLIFVSHDLETIKRICDKAILIEKGRIACFDLPKKVVEEFEKILFGAKNKHSHTPVQIEQGEQIEVRSPDSYGDSSIIISNTRFEDADANRLSIFQGGDRIFFCFTVDFKSNIGNPIFSLMLKTVDGLCVYYIDSKILKIAHGSFCVGDCYEFKAELTNNLAPGNYFINTAVRTENGDNQIVHHRLVDVAKVAITPRSEGVYPGGLVDLSACFYIKRLN